MTAQRIATTLLDRAGRTYAADAGIRLLVLSMLLSTRISADIAVAATAELVHSGMGTPRRMRRVLHRYGIAPAGRSRPRRPPRQRRARR